MGTRDNVLKGLDTLIEGLALVDPEIGRIAREGILLGRALVEHNIVDPVQVLADLRTKLRTDWRAALADKFPGG